MWKKKSSGNSRRKSYFMEYRYFTEYRWNSQKCVSFFTSRKIESCSFRLILPIPDIGRSCSPWFLITRHVSINQLNGTRCKRRFDCAFSIEINYTLHLGRMDELIREKFSASIRNAHRNSLFPAEKWCSILSRKRRGGGQFGEVGRDLSLGGRTLSHRTNCPGQVRLGFFFSDIKNFIFPLANNFQFTANERRQCCNYFLEDLQEKFVDHSVAW